MVDQKKNLTIRKKMTSHIPYKIGTASDHGFLKESGLDKIDSSDDRGSRSEGENLKPVNIKQINRKPKTNSDKKSDQRK